MALRWEEIDYRHYEAKAPDGTYSVEKRCGQWMLFVPGYEYANAYPASAEEGMIMAECVRKPKT